MKLFKFENFQLTITEEALLIKAFRDLWERDTSADKSIAKLELGLVYFNCDPRSDYMFIIDDAERLNMIRLQEGLPNTWEPDELILKAMETYKSMSHTTSSMLLSDTRQLVQNLRSQLLTIDLYATDDRGKPIYTLNTITSTIKQIPELSETLLKAEKALAKELDEVEKMRGGGAQKVLENGITF